MNFENLKKEYNHELANKKTTISELLMHKVSSLALKSENYLQKIYGDKIVFGEKTGEKFEANQKKVTKISDEDIEFNFELKKICEKLDQSEFDKNLIELIE